MHPIPQSILGLLPSLPRMVVLAIRNFVNVIGNLAFIFACIFACSTVYAEEAELFRLPVILPESVAAEGLDIEIDGKLDEAIWATLPEYDNLHTIIPATLAEVPHKTHIRFFYTARGLYFGVMAEQPPETLVARLSSRDQFITRDGISITLDPSGEGLYGYWFGVNLGGTLSDGTVLPERQFSNQWDGAWRGASTELPNGYSVEFFLPWSMMTMPEVEGESRKMGFYLSRTVAYKGERWAWPALPESLSVFLSALQSIEIDNFQPKKQFTFYPFASTTYDVIAAEDDYKAGFDTYWRPTSNLQLTATVNPDFGNVESDDVVVNLTSIETFYPEKRPFFLEGQGIFNTTPRSRTHGRGTPTALVNTRRIGGPADLPDVADLKLTGLEENQPSELDGAVKVTGQNGNIRYGALAAIEDDTKLEGTIKGTPFETIVDGRTFGAARFLYESTNSGSRRGIGWITTLVDHANYDAFVHGVDLHYLTAGGTWNTDGQLLYSDVDDVTGQGGFVDIAYSPESGKSHSVGIDYFDKDIEINDFGFLRRNDVIGLRYQYKTSNSSLPNLKQRDSSFLVSQEYNTEGRKVRSGIFFQQDRTFKDNSFLYAELSYFPSRWDDLLSEGNGLFLIDGRRQGGLFWHSDEAKKLQLGFGYFYEDEHLGGTVSQYEYETNWRPNDRFSLSFFVAYRKHSNWLIYHSARDFTTYQADLWLPKLEMDYFLTAKQQLRLTAQWVGIKADEADRLRIPPGDGRFQPLTRNPGDKARDFTIGQLAFQVRYRWEIAPLSDLFIVYTRGSDLPSDTSLGFDDLLSKSWTDRAVDVLTVKLRYRLGS